MKIATLKLLLLSLYNDLLFSLHYDFFHWKWISSIRCSNERVFSSDCEMAFGEEIEFLTSVSTPQEFYEKDELTGLHLEGNRIATLGSEIPALTKLKILSISNNQIRTISTNELPPKLTQLYLAGNPFLCDKQMLPFLQFLNSTEKLTTDEDLCTPSQKGTAPASPALHPCRCSRTNDNIIFADCSSSGLTNLPPFFTEEQVNATTFYLKARSFEIHRLRIEFRHIRGNGDESTLFTPLHFL
ncbi:uncharacterized protein CEXT_776351 [Caerostris extrusa]|uniref:LRRCT domain-containing protein n=1 Tax=Caerostris extrusa TaxID=172846 RepID=A0AAV4NJT9_CAEEX|nr:uncharacterized protein CEXT_776351 [Caerostris extrusa]